MIRFIFGSARLSAAWRYADSLPEPPQVVPERPDVPGRWQYSGDVSLEHGGVFIDISTWDWGYCDAVRITDLDSACGFAGAVLIEHMTINGTKESERIRNAVRSCGDYNWYRCRGTDAPERTKEALRYMIAEALLSYGYCEFDTVWDGYRSSASEMVQTDPDAYMVYDGWRCDGRLPPGTDLFTYVVENHLQD